MDITFAKAEVFRTTLASGGTGAAGKVEVWSPGFDKIVVDISPKAAQQIQDLILRDVEDRLHKLVWVK
jgi:hypothetical protein